MATFPECVRMVFFAGRSACAPVQN